MNPKQAAVIHRDFMEWLDEQFPESLPRRIDEVKALCRSKTWQETGKMPRGFSRMIGNETREQEILTPACIADFVRAVFGGQIALDPCAAIRETDIGPVAKGTVDAKSIYFGTTKTYQTPYVRDGLSLPWEDRTFVNPPFGQLKKWLAKALVEAARDRRLVPREPTPAEYYEGVPGLGFSGGRRIIVLCPQRPRSKWFRDAKRAASVVVDLNRVTFVGYASTFPESLCLLCFNLDKSVVAQHLPESLGEIS